MSPYWLGFAHGIAVMVAAPVVLYALLWVVVRVLDFVFRYVDPQRTKGGFAIEIGPDTRPAPRLRTFGWGFSRKTPLSLRPVRHDHHLGGGTCKTLWTWAGFFVGLRTEPGRA